MVMGTSLVVQWLKLHTCNAGSISSILPRILHVSQCGQKKKQRRIDGNNVTAFADRDFPYVMLFVYVLKIDGLYLFCFQVIHYPIFCFKCVAVLMITCFGIAKTKSHTILSFLRTLA